MGHISHMDVNQPHPTNAQANANDYNQTSNNQTDNTLLQHQQLKMGLGLDFFGGAPDHDQVSTQMQVPPPPPFNSTNLTQAALSSDPRFYMHRHLSAPLPATNQNLKPSTETNTLQNQNALVDTFQYDSVLSLTGNLQSQIHGKASNEANQTSFTSVEDTMHRLPSYKLPENQPSVIQNQHHITNEQTAVNNMFDDALATSFDNFSGNLGSNFFDFLSEKPIEERSHGLGGVRLDMTSDNVTTIDSEQTANHFGPSNWGPQ